MSPTKKPPAGGHRRVIIDREGTQVEGQFTAASLVCPVACSTMPCPYVCPVSIGDALHELVAELVVAR